MLRRFTFPIQLLSACTLLAQVPAPSPIPAPPVTPPLVAPATVDHSQESYVVKKLKSSFRFENDGTGKSIRDQLTVSGRDGVLMTCYLLA